MRVSSGPSALPAKNIAIFPAEYILIFGVRDRAPFEYVRFRHSNPRIQYSRNGKFPDAIFRRPTVQ